MNRPLGCERATSDSISLRQTEDATQVSHKTREQPATFVIWVYREM